MKLYIPENLDIDQIIYDYPPNFKKYKHKRDKLLYIIHLINALTLYNKDLMYDDFVPISAKILQDKIYNYKEYLNYLMNVAKIIETDNQYFVGFKSKGFRLTEKYRSEVAIHSISDYTFHRKLKVERNNRAASVNHLNYLTKWFNEKLEIDIDYVNKFLSAEYELKKDNKSLWQSKKVNTYGKIDVKYKDQ